MAPERRTWPTECIAGLINDMRRRANRGLHISQDAAGGRRRSWTTSVSCEYAWEFCPEGTSRRQQLIRFGVFTTKKWFQHEGTGEDAHLNIFRSRATSCSPTTNSGKNPEDIRGVTSKIPATMNILKYSFYAPLVRDAGYERLRR